MDLIRVLGLIFARLAPCTSTGIACLSRAGRLWPGIVQYWFSCIPLLSALLLMGCGVPCVKSDFWLKPLPRNVLVGAGRIADPTCRYPEVPGRTLMPRPGRGQPTLRLRILSLHSRVVSHAPSTGFLARTSVPTQNRHIGPTHALQNGGKATNTRRRSGDVPLFIVMAFGMRVDVNKCSPKLDNTVWGTI